MAEENNNKGLQLCQDLTEDLRSQGWKKQTTDSINAFEKNTNCGWIDIDGYFNQAGVLNPKIEVQFYITDVDETKKWVDIRNLLDGTSNFSQNNNCFVSATITDNGAKNLELVLFDRSFYGIQEILYNSLKTANLDPSLMEAETSQISNLSLGDLTNFELFKTEATVENNIRIRFGYNDFNPPNEEVKKYLSSIRSKKSTHRWNASTSGQTGIYSANEDTAKADNDYELVPESVLSSMNQTTLYSGWYGFMITGLSSVLTDTGIKYTIKGTAVQDFALNNYKFYQTFKKLVGTPSNLLDSLANAFNNNDNSLLKICWDDSPDNKELKKYINGRYIQKNDAGNLQEINSDELQKKIEEKKKEQDYANLLKNLSKDLLLIFTQDGSIVNKVNNFRSDMKDGNKYKKYFVSSSDLESCQNVWDFLNIHGDEKMKIDISFDKGGVCADIAVRKFASILQEGNLDRFLAQSRAIEDIPKSVKGKGQNANSAKDIKFESVCKYWFYLALRNCGLLNSSTYPTSVDNKTLKLEAGNAQLANVFSEIDYNLDKDLTNVFGGADDEIGEKYKLKAKEIITRVWGEISGGLKKESFLNRTEEKASKERIEKNNENIREGYSDVIKQIKKINTESASDSASIQSTIDNGEKVLEKEIEIILGSEASANSERKYSKSIASIFNEICNKAPLLISDQALKSINENKIAVRNGDGGTDAVELDMSDTNRYKLDWKVDGFYEKNGVTIPIIKFYYRKPQKLPAIRRYCWGTGNAKPHAIKSLSIDSSTEFAMLSSATIIKEGSGTTSYLATIGKSIAAVQDYYPGNQPVATAKIISGNEQENIVMSQAQMVANGTMVVIGDPSLTFQGRIQPYSYPIYIDISMQMENTWNSNGKPKTIKNFMSGFYVIKTITHNISNSGFYTTLEIARYPIKDVKEYTERAFATETEALIG